MTVDDNLLWAAIESDDAFREELKRVLDEELYMSARDFARAAGLGESTFYKMLSGGRRPNLTSLRRVILAVQDRLCEKRGKFVALIVSRTLSEEMATRVSKMDLGDLSVKVYPAFNTEEAIIQSIEAERAGAVALVCAPIVSTTIEKILHIPVATIQPRECVLDAIGLAADKWKTKRRGG